jgi:uncharacterized protein (TIGR00297 family)
MEQEMHQQEWKKAISSEKDRLQSNLLAWTIGVILVALTCETLRRALPFAHQFPLFVFGAFGISAAFALVVLALRAATPAGAASGGMICLLITFWTGSLTGSRWHTGLTPLLLLFLLTFLATRVGRQQKTEAGLAEKRSGRTAAQVIANLSIAGLTVSPLMGWAFHWGMAYTWLMKTICLAALVEATADTVSSEIGQAFGGQPLMITTLRPVSAGTDGAVTLLGSCSGIVGGALVALAGGWAMRLNIRAAMVALAAGICGLFLDSLLGATLERRGWLGNDLVNFVSTLFAATFASIAYRFL